MSLIELRNVSKTYQLGETRVEALRGLDLSIGTGDFIAVWGPSGSGKSTLLNLIGLIDLPSSGQLHIEGQDVAGLNDSRLTELRRRKIGFIFQNFNLVPVLSALENVALPLQLGGVSEREALKRARKSLEEVELGEKAEVRPDKLSGGQRQRVAIARALVTAPALVLADEPTANLDSQTSEKIIALMRTLNQSHQVTFVFSTHDDRLLAHVPNRIRLEDGRLAATR